MRGATEARVSSMRVWSHGDSIFSYGRHFTIARHVTQADGKAAVLLTTSGRGNATAKHKLHVWRATFRAQATVWNVSDPSKAPSVADVAEMVAEAADIAKAATRARVYRESRANRASKLLDNAAAFAAAFGLAAPDAAAVAAVRAVVDSVLVPLRAAA